MNCMFAGLSKVVFLAFIGVEESEFIKIDPTLLAIYAGAAPGRKTRGIFVDSAMQCVCCLYVHRGLIRNFLAQIGVESNFFIVDLVLSNVLAGVDPEDKNDCFYSLFYAVMWYSFYVPGAFKGIFPLKMKFLFSGHSGT